MTPEKPTELPPHSTPRPLSIGIVTEHYYPVLGGVSENVFHTARDLVARGHRVRIITPTQPRGAAARLAMPDGIPVTNVGRAIGFRHNGAHTNAAIGMHLWRDLGDTLRGHHFDILQLHSPLTPTLSPLAALLARAPRVGTFHSYFDSSHVYALFHKVLQREFLGRIHGLTAVSPSVAEALSRYFDVEPRIIPNGVDTTEFHPDVPRLARFDPGKRTLLFLGRFHPRNGLGFMLQAFRLVRERVGNVRLVVVGSGPLDRHDLRLAGPEALSDVHFEGPALLERPAYYRTADVFCSPVSKASFGITLLEAMAAGTPIVATDNVGYRALLGPEEGFLVPRNVEAFADGIIRLLDDDGLRAAMGAAGRRKALRFAWPVVVDQLLEYFGEIIARK